MISYGSQICSALMPYSARSHQLGEGQSVNAAMSPVFRPSRSVYGSQSRYAEMPCNQLLPPVRGGSQIRLRGAILCTPSSISFTEATSFKPKGQSYIASKGKGQTNHATMSPVFRPSPPVYGGQKSSTGSSHRHRLHQFTGAFVTTQQCPSMIAPTYSREVSFDSQKCHLSNASQGKGHHALAEMPFMVRLSPPVYGRNTNRSQQCQMKLYLPPVLGHLNYAAMLISKRPILTRGHLKVAEMPFIKRLATKEIQYGHKI